MTTVPIGTSDQPDYDPTAVTDDAADAALARELSGRSIWVDRDFLQCGLHPARQLAYLAAVDRANNITRQYIWDPAAIAAACGSTHAKAYQGVPGAFAKAGVLQSIEYRSGRKTRIVLPKVHPKRRTPLPLQAIWNKDGAPRWGKDTAKVARWLMIRLRVGDWHRHGLVSTSDLSAPQIAKRAGVSLSDYQRVWAVVRTVLKDEPWVTWTQLEREDGGLGAYEVVIDWTRLGAENAVTLQPETTLPTSDNPPDFQMEGVPTFGQGGTPASEQGGSRLLNDLYKEASALNPVLSPPLLPPSSTQRDASPHHRHEPAPTPADNGGKGQATEESLSQWAAATTDRNAISERLGSLIDEAGGQQHITDDVWLALVIANIVHARPDHAITLKRLDIARLTEALPQWRQAGWDPLSLAAALIETRAPREVSAPASLILKRLESLKGIKPPTPTPTAHPVATNHIEAHWMEMGFIPSPERTDVWVSVTRRRSAEEEARWAALDPRTYDNIAL